MNEVKSFLLSKTLLGVIVLLLSNVFKVNTDTAFLTDLINNGFTVIGATLAIYGRLTASQKLKL